MPKDLVTLLHYTSESNLPKILKSGLSTEEYSQGKVQNNIYAVTPEWFINASEDKRRGLGIPMGPGVAFQVDPKTAYAGYSGTGLLGTGLFPAYHRTRLDQFLAQKQKPDLYEVTVPYNIPANRLKALPDTSKDREIATDWWKLLSYGASGTMLYAGLTATDVPFKQRMGEIVGRRATPIVTRIPTAIWMGGEAKRIYNDPSWQNIGRFALGWAGWEAGMSAATKITSRYVRGKHLGLPGVVGHIVAPLVSNIAANIIPGTDDEHNTIRGLNEKGLAAGIRKTMTDFGSGYQGLKQSEEKPKLSWGTFIGSQLGVGAAVQAASMASVPLAIHTLKKYPQEVSQQDFLDLIKKAGASSQVETIFEATHPAEYFYHPIFKSGSIPELIRTMFLPPGHAAHPWAKKRFMHIGKKPDIALGLHEFGHSMGKEWLMSARLAAPKIAPVLGFGSLAYFFGRYSQNRKTSNDRVTGMDYAVGLAPFAAISPMLVEEARASIYGLRVMKQFGLPGIKKAAMKSVAAFGTYAAQGASMLVPLAGYALAMRLSRGKKEDHNTISGMPENGVAALKRQTDTDFGSGYQGAKALIHFTGKRAQSQFVASEFKKVLQGEFANIPGGLTWKHKLKSFGSVISDVLATNRRTFPSREVAARINIGTEEAKSTFRKLSRKYHPDVGGTTEQFQELQNYYETILKKKKFVQGQGEVVGIDIPWRTFSTKEFQSIRNATIAFGYGITFGPPILMAAALNKRKKEKRRKKKQAIIELLSKEDHNTIAGMQEDGLAARLRKENTDFGSGYQGLPVEETPSYVVENRSWREELKANKQFLQFLRFSGFVFAAPGYLMAETEQPRTMLQKIYGRKMGRVISAMPAATFFAGRAIDVALGEEPLGEALSSAAGWGAVSLALKYPFEALGRKIGHMGAARLMRTGLGMAGGYLARTIYKKHFAKDPGVVIPEENAGYGTINGLPPTGEGHKIIKSLTPFGSKVDRLKVIAQRLGQTLDEVRASKAFHEALAKGRFTGTELGKGAWGKVELFETELAGEKLFFARKTSTRASREEVIAEAHMRFEKEKKMLIKFSGLGEQEAARKARKQALGFMKEKVRELSFRLEASKLERAGHEGIVPTAYRSKFGMLDMEAAGHMDEALQFHPAETFQKLFGSAAYKPTKELEEALAQGIVEPRRMMGQVERQVISSKQRGLINTDIHDEQFLLSPKTGDVWWVDWGLAYTKRTNPVIFSQQDVFRVHVLDSIATESNNVAVAISNWRQRAAVGKDLDTYADMMLKEVRQQGIPQQEPQLIAAKTGKAKGRAAGDRLERAALQRSAQAQMWHAAQSAGQKHGQAYTRRIRRSRNPNDIR